MSKYDEVAHYQDFQDLLNIIKKSGNNYDTRKIQKAYNIACDSINEHGLQAYRDIIRTCCNATDQTLDSLPDLHFEHAAPPRTTDSLRAVKWLRSVRQNYSKPDSVSTVLNTEQKNPRTLKEPSRVVPRTLKDTSRVEPRTSKEPSRVVPRTSKETK